MIQFHCKIIFHCFVFLQATLVLEVLLDSKVIPSWTLCKTPLNIQGPDVTYSSWIEGQPMVRCECSFCILFPVWSKSKVFNICAGTYIFEKASFTSKSYLCKLFWNLIGFFDPHTLQYPITANWKKIYIYFRKKRGAVFLLLVWKSNFYASMWRLFGEFCSYWISYYFWVRK